MIWILPVMFGVIIMLYISSYKSIYYQNEFSNSIKEFQKNEKNNIQIQDP